MNYIKRLQSEVKEQSEAVKAIRTELLDLEKYLLSAKFHNDPTVQIQDVLNRIEQAKFLTLGQE